MSPIKLECRGLFKYVVKHIKLLVQQCCRLSSLFCGLFKVVGWLNSVADCEVYMSANSSAGCLPSVVCTGKSGTMMVDKCNSKGLLVAECNMPFLIFSARLRES